MLKRGIKIMTLVLKKAGIMMLAMTLVMPFFEARAAMLITARDYLNRNAGNLTSGVEHEIVITPATNVSGGAGANSVIVQFPDADDQMWCRTAGTMTLSTASLHDSAVALPGTLAASCTQGSGSSSYDTITITGVNNLAAGTVYGVDIAANTAALGTPASGNSEIVTIKTNDGTADIDSRSIAIALAASDQVTVTGYVDPTLTFAISDTQIGFGSITPTGIRHATADELGSAVAPGNDLPTQISVSTNAQSGLVVEMRDLNAGGGSGLYNSTPATTLASMASTSVALGTDGFGVYAKNASANLTIDEGFDNDSTADLAVSNTFQPIVSASTGIATSTFDLAAVAAIDGATPPGNYADTLTLVATGRF